VRIGDLAIEAPGIRGQGKLTLVVRPEAIKFVNQPVDTTAAGIPGRILRRAFLGNMARYWIETSMGEWIVDEPTPDSRLRPDDVRLTFIADRLHALPSN
jgi:ABC-type Fe3+/spermidine/putrescine transport system ATPase subunit